MRLLAVVVAALLSMQVVRNAAVAALAERSPDTAARVWPHHPQVGVSLGMTEIGRAAGLRKPVPAWVFAMMDEAAVKAPLAPEPFLVRGVQKQLAGDAPTAIRAFSAAARRDPRSLPAHYFLADTLFRSGDTRRGLEEIGILARLAPGGANSLAPYVASYAKDPRTWPQLRELFRSSPSVEDAALVALASDPANVETIMSLADTEHRGPAAIWLPNLLNSLVASGQYRKAHEVWARISGARLMRGALLYDPGFAQPSAPPPFNWVLTSSPVGIAERAPGGGLHVIFYGREDGVLARQLLVLAPGRYRMSLSASGDAAQAQGLNWSVRCDGSQTPIAAVPAAAAASRPLTFSVPSGCAAQWLELSGIASDVAHQSELTVKAISLTSERSGG